MAVSRGAVVVAVATSELEGEFDVVANLGVGGGVPGGPGFTKRTPFRSVPKTWTTGAWWVLFSEIK